MLPVHLIQQNSSSLMQCTPSIECQPQYEHLAAGVVAIYAVDPRARTVSLCSGAPTFGSASHPWQLLPQSRSIYETTFPRRGFIRIYCTACDPVSEHDCACDHCSY